MRCCRDLLDALGRRQPWDARGLQHSNYRRSLGFLDLLGLGIGSVAGVGVYVLSAHVTKKEAGPSSVLSVIIASVTALLAGLCHAELAGRLPRAGTGYTYCYVTLGELSAFVVGWAMLLDHVLTAAVAAKAWGQYLHYMLNDTLSQTEENLLTWQLPEAFASRPDVLACVVMLIVSLCSFLSVKAFSVLTFALTILSGFVLLAFVCVGYFHVQAHNWTQPPGFFANGFGGMLSGASLLMSVFAGVDHVAAASQETRDPSRHLPSALPVTTVLLFLILLLATSALTLACPWQDLTETAPIARAFETKGIYAANHVIGVGALLGLSAAAMGGLFHPPRILHCMARDGLLPACLGRTSLASTPVLASFLCGLAASVLAFSLESACLVEMSAIGTVVQFLTSAVIVLYVRYQPEPVGLCKEYSDLDLSLVAEDVVTPHHHPRSQSPKLVLMANGNLHLHYANNSHQHNNRHSYNNNQQHHHHHHHQQQQQHQHQQDTHNKHRHLNSSFGNACSGGGDETEMVETSALFSSSASSGGGAASRGGGTAAMGNDDENCACRRVVRSGSTTSLSSSLVQLSSCTKLTPDWATWQSTRHFLLVFLLASTCLAASGVAWPAHPRSSWWAVTLTCISVAVLVVSAVGMARQPQNDYRLHFKTPYVPLLPLLSLVLCSLLLAALPYVAWLRFAIWSLLGLVVYFCYGIRNSVHRTQDEQEVVLFDISNRNRNC